jgi:hypothetical protein
VTIADRAVASSAGDSGSSTRLGNSSQRRVTQCAGCASTPVHHLRQPPARHRRPLRAGHDVHRGWAGHRGGARARVGSDFGLRGSRPRRWRQSGVRGDPPAERGASWSRIRVRGARPTGAGSGRRLWGLTGCLSPRGSLQRVITPVAAQAERLFRRCGPTRRHPCLAKPTRQVPQA